MRPPRCLQYKAWRCLQNQGRFSILIFFDLISTHPSPNRRLFVVRFFQLSLPLLTGMFSIKVPLRQSFISARNRRMFKTGVKKEALKALEEAQAEYADVCDRTQVKAED